MGKIIITYHEVLEINHKLEENNLSFKLHLHDTCGNQSFTVEPLGDGNDNEAIEEMNRIITAYFENKRIKIQFSSDKLAFQVIQNL